MPGIEPGASHMQSVRSTTELHPHSTRMGFEPTCAEHNGLAVHRLNHSAKHLVTTHGMTRKAHNYFHS